MQNFLDFEKPLLDIKSKIEELRHLKDTSENIANELSNLQEKYDRVLSDLYNNLTPIQKVKVGFYKINDFADLSSDELIGGFDEFKRLRFVVIRIDQSFLR